MANISINRKILPEKVQIEIDNILNNKKTLFKVSQTSLNTISNNKEETIFIDENSSLSTNIFFFKGIKNSYSTTALAGSTNQEYSNLLSNTSSANVSSIYEHIRSYIYRPSDWPTYISSNKGPYIISNSTTGTPTLPSIPGALTGVRMIQLNKTLYKDYIKPNSFKLNIVPINVNLTINKGLRFNNSNISDSSSGQYASITGFAGLSGSLSSGVAGKVVTGFTIAIKFKPINSGSITQVLLHRRIADQSLSSLDYINGPIDSKIITQKYSDLNPLSAISNISSYTKTFNINIAPFTNNDPLTSIVIQLTNKGGGQLKWAASAQNTESVNWLSLSSSVTSGTLFGINNITSTTATLTALVKLSVTALTKDVTHTSNLIIYNNDIYEKSPNLPISIPFNITWTPA